MAIDRKSLGKRIQKHRKELDLTQATLAERAKLDTTYLSQVERGVKSPSLDALARIAKALKVGLGALLEDTRASKSVPLTKEIAEILSAWTPKQRRAVLQALRTLAEL